MTFRRARISRAFACLALTTLPAVALSQSLDGRPFRAFPVSTMPFGEHALELGVETRDGVVPVPLLSPVSGDLSQLVVRYRMGLGRAELSLGGAAWQSFDRDAATSETSVGDLSFWVRIKAVEPKHHRVGLGFALGAKLPNASADTGLGSDEADIFGAVLIGQELERSEWRMNLGLAILGDPASDTSQEDLLTYGLAARFGLRHALLSEVWGRALASDMREIEEGAVRLGYGYRGDRIQFDACLLQGLEVPSGNLGATVGVTWLLGRPRGE